MGALLFVILNWGDRPKADSRTERHLHYLEGVSRIIAGGISGVLVGGSIQLGLILPVFTKSGMQSLAMCVAAMISGASEKLAAGIVTGIENRNNQKERANDN